MIVDPLLNEGSFMEKAANRRKSFWPCPWLYPKVRG